MLRATISLLLATACSGRKEPAPVMRHAHAVPLATLLTKLQTSVPDYSVGSDGVTGKLPVHGVMIFQGYIGHHTFITVDADASTLRVWSIEWGSSPVRRDSSRALAPGELSKLLELANAAWREDPVGPMLTVPDIVEELFVVDGDEGFYLAGEPIRDSGRPAAARAVDALFSAAVPP